MPKRPLKYDDFTIYIVASKFLIILLLFFSHWLIWLFSRLDPKTHVSDIYFLEDECDDLSSGRQATDTRLPDRLECWWAAWPGPSLPPSHYLPGRYAGSLSLGRRMTLAQGPLSPSVYSILHGLSSRVLLSVSLFSIFIIISFFLLFQSEATFIFVLFLLFFSAHISVVCADTSAKK